MLYGGSSSLSVNVGGSGSGISGSLSYSTNTSGLDIQNRHDLPHNQASWKTYVNASKIFSSSWYIPYGQTFGLQPAVRITTTKSTCIICTRLSDITFLTEKDSYVNFPDGSAWYVFEY